MEFEHAELHKSIPIFVYCIHLYWYSLFVIAVNCRQHYTNRRHAKPCGEMDIRVPVERLLIKQCPKQHNQRGLEALKELLPFNCVLTLSYCYYIFKMNNKMMDIIKYIERFEILSVDLNSLYDLIIKLKLFKSRSSINYDIISWKSVAINVILMFTCCTVVSINCQISDDDIQISVKYILPWMSLLFTMIIMR